jgi:hypothetical protein
VAYDRQIRNVSGLEQLVAKYGEWFTYNFTARAMIFAREAPKVKK